MVVYGGESNHSAVLYASQQGSNVPFEGVISDGNALRVDFTSEDPDGEPTFNIRFEGDAPHPVPQTGRTGGGGGWDYFFLLLNVPN